MHDHHEIEFIFGGSSHAATDIEEEVFGLK